MYLSALSELYSMPHSKCTYSMMDSTGPSVIPVPVDLLFLGSNVVVSCLVTFVLLLLFYVCVICLNLLSLVDVNSGQR